MEKYANDEEMNASAKQQYNCQVCKNEFIQFDLYISHFETCKNYKCGSCGKSFSQKSNLKKHIHTVHEGLKDHKCEFCGKSFFDASTLKKHILTVHEGQKNYKCELCGKSFSSADALKYHNRTRHDGHKNLQF